MTYSSTYAIDFTHIPHIVSPAVFIADAHYIPDSTCKQTQQSNTHSTYSTSNVTRPSPQNPLESTWAFLDSSAPYPLYIGERGLIGLLQSFMLEPPAQIFLMGDIAHLFIPHITHNAIYHETLITLLNDLSQRTTIYYFEGNHDFGIDSRLLPKVKIYPRTLQPAIFMYQNMPFLLAHGDLFIDKGYEFYIRTLNAPLILSCLKLIDILTLGYIYHCIQSRVNTKHIKSLTLNASEFEDFARTRLVAYKHSLCRANRSHTLHQRGIDLLDITNECRAYTFGVIEGHFHIGRQYQNFFALPSFYCEKRILVL